MSYPSPRSCRDDRGTLCCVTSPAPLARWWREPWWARLTLAGIVGGFVVLACWNLARGGDFSFYEASARSMSASWRALLFGAFDPAATVTLDKLSGFAVPQALSIRLFGMSISAIALPQVLEGVVTILACAVVGLRWGGRGAGLVAALAAASTPIFVSMFAHPMEDGMLTMAVSIALVWWQRAVLTARLWPLLMCALFIGVGFQAKMMSAWFVLPALVVATLVAAPSWRRGAVGAGLLTGAAVTASLAWMAGVALVPGGSRPYIDGSTDDDIFAMVFGYNGLDRFAPGLYPGSVGSSGSTSVAAALAHALSAPASSADETTSHLKLLELPLVTQIGWLYPAALAGIVLGVWALWARRRHPASRARLALVVAAAAWLGTAAAVLSFTRVPHTAYVAALGVPLAVLTAVAWSVGVRSLSSPRWVRRSILPAVVIGQGAWWAVLVAHARLPVVLLVPAAALGAAGALIGVLTADGSRRGTSAAARARRRRNRPAAAAPTPATDASRPGDPAADLRGPLPVPRRRVDAPRAARSASVALAVALLCLPVATSLQVLDAARDGSGADAYVGVTGKGGHPDEEFAVSSPRPWGGSPHLTPAVGQLAQTAAAHGGGADGSALMITDSWAISAQIIDATGAEVLTDGGYSSHVNVFSVADLQRMVETGRVHLLAVASGAAVDDPVRQVATGPGCRSLGSWTFTDAGEGGDVGKVGGVGLYECRA